jgi:NAD(P)-dependent dehydrogenase (short-subunit alcohol dehydrogenase family)
MPRTILVTEGDSPLGGALTRLLLARGFSVAALQERAPVASGERTGSAPRPSLAVAWNRRSPVSAHTILLTVLNAFESIDDVLILEPPIPDGPSLREAQSADIERALDDAKGPMFLAREALSYFHRSGAGVLCMVSGGPSAGPVAGAARECFRGLAGSLLSGSGEQGVVANGFQTAGADPEEYAAFIDRTLEEKARKISGRWFAFQPRGGFLQGVLSGSRT